MLFNDLKFIYFFIPVLIIFHLLNLTKKKWVKNTFLLAVSYLFYGLFEAKFLFVLIYITIINYGIILLLSKKKDKSILTLGIILSLLPLVFFKYTYFLLNDVLGIEGEVFGKIILPVGISFFTFQALSYTIDIYRQKENVIPSLLDFSLYTAFFPTVLSGPIERARTLMPQIKNLQHCDFHLILNGIQLFTWGVFQKIVIADRISEYVGHVYAYPESYGTTTILLTISLYSIQIYCDFAGYSNMAIGIGRMLGFYIYKNFNFPYFSTSIYDFWKKWHISLTSWLTEYVYFSLGGNRVKKWRWMLNILIVFLVSGIWHGAAWTFIVWGGIHGIYQIIEHYVLGKKKFKNSLSKIVAGSTLFTIVSLAWVFFRANSIEQAWNVLSSLGNLNIPLFTMFATQFFLMLFILFIWLIIELTIYKRVVKITESNDNPFTWINLIFMSLAASMICLLGTSGSSFVYFQF